MTQEKTTEQLKVKLLPTAAQEIKNILRDVQRECGTKTAQKIREDLVTKTKERLANNPYLGRPLFEYPAYEQKGIRRYFLHPHYSILYLVTEKTVEIWHIWDNRRDWTTLFEKE